MKFLVRWTIYYVIVEKLVEKYGKGNIGTRKCSSCSYEQAIQRSGVHADESGCVQVYAEDDKFICPNCDEEDPLEILNTSEDGITLTCSV